LKTFLLCDRPSTHPVPKTRLSAHTHATAATAPSLHEAVQALVVDDEEQLLFSVAGVGPEEDGGVALDTVQVGALLRWCGLRVTWC